MPAAALFGDNEAHGEVVASLALLQQLLLRLLRRERILDVTHDHRQAGQCIAAGQFVESTQLFQHPVRRQVAEQQVIRRSLVNEASITIAFSRFCLTPSATAAQTLLRCVLPSTASGPVSPKHSTASPSLSSRKAVDCTPPWLSGKAVTLMAVSLSGIARPGLRSSIVYFLRCGAFPRSVKFGQARQLK